MFADSKGRCPNCDQASGFKRLEYRGRIWPELYSRQPGGGSLAGPRAVRDYASLTILECLFCGDTVVLVDRHERPDLTKSGDYIVSRTMVAPHPKPRTLDPAAPAEVCSMFEEASVCENAGAMRAAGVMYRAAVEALVVDQGATGPNLYKRIDSLRDRDLPADLADDLHEARMLGNDSIHDGLTYSAEEVADVAKLIEEAVLVLYVQPAEKDRMREQRRQRRSGSDPST